MFHPPNFPFHPPPGPGIPGPGMMPGQPGPVPGTFGFHGYGSNQNGINITNFANFSNQQPGAPQRPCPPWQRPPPPPFHIGPGPVPGPGPFNHQHRAHIPFAPEHHRSNMPELYLPTPAAPLTPRLRPADRVQALLTDGTMALVSRRHLDTHFPRTRNHVCGRIFDVHHFFVAYEYDPGHFGMDVDLFVQGLDQAVTRLFRVLESMAAGNNSSNSHAPDLTLDLDLFSRARFYLANAPASAQPDAVMAAFQHAFFVCCALDQDRGLGSSDVLGAHVGRFLVELLPRVQALGLGLAVYLFVGLARIFRETSPDMVAALGAFWAELEEEDRLAVVDLMAGQLPRDGRGSNSTRIWGALRRMRLV